MRESSQGFSISIERKKLFGIQATSYSTTQTYLKPKLRERERKKERESKRERERKKVWKWKKYEDREGEIEGNSMVKMEGDDKVLEVVKNEIERSWFVPI